MKFDFMLIKFAHIYCCQQILSFYFRFNITKLHKSLISDPFYLLSNKRLQIKSTHRTH